MQFPWLCERRADHIFEHWWKASVGVCTSAVHGPDALGESYTAAARGGKIADFSGSIFDIIAVGATSSARGAVISSAAQGEKAPSEVTIGDGEINNIISSIRGQYSSAPLSAGSGSSASEATQHAESRIQGASLTGARRIAEACSQIQGASSTGPGSLAEGCSRIQGASPTVPGSIANRHRQNEGASPTDQRRSLQSANLDEPTRREQEEPRSSGSREHRQIEQHPLEAAVEARESSKANFAPHVQVRSRLLAWAEKKNLARHQIHDILLLLDPAHLRSLPRRRKSKAWPHAPDAKTYRHHFYRQVAHILGWREQHSFEEEFTSLVRSYWPDKQDATPKIN